MAKRSRRTVGAGAVSARTGTRPARRHEAGYLERYRTLLITGVGVAGLLIIFIFIFGSGARAAYECALQLTPGPVESVTPRPPTPAPTPTPVIVDATPAATTTPAPSPGASASPAATPEPTPEPEPTARLGFTTTDLGANHTRDPNQTLEYGYCPPASGPHFEAPLGPIRSAVYPPNDERSPGGWVHNLEHGFVVMLYRCPSGIAGEGDCLSATELAALQQFYDTAPDSGVANCANKVVVARFDSMSTRFAIVAWDRALLMDEFDLDKAITFTEQWLDHASTPERGAC